MSRAKKIIELMEEDELFSFPSSPEDKSVFPFSAEGVKLSLERKLASLGIEGILVDSAESDAEGNIIVTFTDYEDNAIDVVFSCGEEGCVAILNNQSGDWTLDDEDNIVVDLSPLGVPVVDVGGKSYINMLVLDWLNKPTVETILTAGALLSKEPSSDNIQRDAFGNIIIVPVPEEYEYDIEKLECENNINENDDIVEVVYKVVIRGGKKVRRPIVRRLRKKRLSPKQRAGLRKAARTRKSPKSKMKRRKSTLLRKRLRLKPSRMKKGFRVG